MLEKVTSCWASAGSEHVRGGMRMAGMAGIETAADVSYDDQGNVAG